MNDLNLKNPVQETVYGTEKNQLLLNFDHSILPKELVMHLFLYLTRLDLYHLSYTSKTWNEKTKTATLSLICSNFIHIHALFHDKFKISNTEFFNLSNEIKTFHELKNPSLKEIRNSEKDLAKLFLKNVEQSFKNKQLNPTFYYNSLNSTQNLKFISIFEINYESQRTLSLMYIFNEINILYTQKKEIVELTEKTKINLKNIQKENKLNYIYNELKKFGSKEELEALKENQYKDPYFGYAECCAYHLLIKIDEKLTNLHRSSLIWKELKKISEIISYFSEENTQNKAIISSIKPLLKSKEFKLAFKILSTNYYHLYTDSDFKRVELFQKEKIILLKKLFNCLTEQQDVNLKKKIASLLKEDVVFPTDPERKGSLQF